MVENERGQYPSVPHEFSITTGSEELLQAEEVVKNFFKDILDFIGYDDKAQEVFTSVETREMFSGRSAIKDRITSDDLLRILIARDYIVASSFFRRDDYNRWQVALAHYLNDDMLDNLREGIVEA